MRAPRAALCGRRAAAVGTAGRERERVPVARQGPGRDQPKPVGAAAAARRAARRGRPGAAAAGAQLGAPSRAPGEGQGRVFCLQACGAAGGLVLQPLALDSMCLLDWDYAGNTCCCARDNVWAAGTCAWAPPCICIRARCVQLVEARARGWSQGFASQRCSACSLCALCSACWPAHSAHERRNRAGAGGRWRGRILKDGRETQAARTCTPSFCLAHRCCG